jgi:hypothetical protein
MDIKKAFAPVALAAMLTGCDASAGGHNTQSVLTCFDYSGNVTFRDHIDRVTLHNDGTMTVRHDKGDDSFIVSPQCLEEYTENTDTERYNRAASDAKYDVVVTNGVDRILLSGKFDEVRRSDGGIKAELTDGNILIHKIQVYGLPTVATPQKAALSDALKTASPAP